MNDSVDVDEPHHTLNTDHKIHIYDIITCFLTFFRTIHRYFRIVCADPACGSFSGLV